LIYKHFVPKHYDPDLTVFRFYLKTASSQAVQ